ncbi:MAG TPA: GNAT family N-acetyltransferase [Candidatus Absconditabacterales bacterium]|nr:GNAT family N-acetyltransferase [Candidatus Absconditabacterales bacterium]
MKLEFPAKKHEQQYFEMIQEFLDNKETIIPMSMELKEGKTYDDFLERMNDNKKGINLKPGRVRSELYFLIDENEKIIGAEAIRYELNDELRFDAGNIGYGIRPSERKKGYATIGLTLALQKCKEAGLDKVLLTCKKENIGSAKTIIKNGGIWDSEYIHEGHTKERYWIAIK